MQLGMQLGYDDPIGSVAMAQEADRLGFHSVWTSEAWGVAAVTVASWIAATTEQIGIGTAVLQMPARTPALTAMTVATLDQLSGGRVSTSRSSARRCSGRRSSTTASITTSRTPASVRAASASR